MLATDDIFKKIAERTMEIKILQDELDSLKAVVKGYMEEYKLEEIIGTEHKAVYKMIPSTRIDTKRLEEEHPRIAKQYKVDNSYMRFNFT